MIKKGITMFTTFRGFTEYANSSLLYIISLGLYIISVIALWKLFEKAGEEGWKAIIPFYNAYMTSKLSMNNGWLFLLVLIPIIRVIYTGALCYAISKSFGKKTPYAIGLFFLYPIFIIMLGFDNSRYLGPWGNGAGGNSTGSGYYDDGEHEYIYTDDNGWD